MDSLKCKICTLIAVSLAVSLGPKCEVNPEIPAEFHGVWRTTSAINDGDNQPLAEDPVGSQTAGECEMLEIFICETRAVLVTQTVTLWLVALAS